MHQKNDASGFVCDPGGILTHDLQNRNLTFYTAELRVLSCGCKSSKKERKCNYPADKMFFT